MQQPAAASCLSCTEHISCTSIQVGSGVLGPGCTSAWYSIQSSGPDAAAICFSSARHRLHLSAGGLKKPSHQNVDAMCQRASCHTKTGTLTNTCTCLQAGSVILAQAEGRVAQGHLTNHSGRC